MKILSKQECYKKYNQGTFGNRPLRWNTWKKVKQSNYRGMICIRGIGIPRSEVKYDVPFNKIENTIKQYKEKDIPPSTLRFNQSMPNEKILIQGEVKKGIKNLDLTHTTIKKPMNLALAEEEKYTNGLTAIQILKHNLSPSSFSDLEALFELYPKSVIEFSAYSYPVRNIPGRNTII